MSNNSYQLYIQLLVYQDQLGRERQTTVISGASQHDSVPKVIYYIEHLIRLKYVELVGLMPHVGQSDGGDKIC